MREHCRGRPPLQPRRRPRMCPASCPQTTLPKPHLGSNVASGRLHKLGSLRRIPSKRIPGLDVAAVDAIARIKPMLHAAERLALMLQLRAANSFESCCAAQTTHSTGRCGKSVTQLLLAPSKKLATRGCSEAAGGETRHLVKTQSSCSDAQAAVDASFAQLAAGSRSLARGDMPALGLRARPGAQLAPTPTPHKLVLVQEVRSSASELASLDAVPWDDLKRVHDAACSDAQRPQPPPLKQASRPRLPRAANQHHSRQSSNTTCPPAPRSCALAAESRCRAAPSPPESLQSCNSTWTGCSAGWSSSSTTAWSMTSLRRRAPCGSGGEGPGRLEGRVGGWRLDFGWR